jgi:hypothetical protein
MITTEEIQKVINQYKERVNDVEYNKKKKKEAFESRKLEKDILSSKCIYNIHPEEINKFYSKIDAVKITEYNHFNNYDTGLLDTALAACSKLYLSTYPGSLENNERVMEWIRNIRFLVSKNLHSVELAESITKLKENYYGMDTLSIKSPRLDPNENGEISSERLDYLTHEAFVGIFGLNPLRKMGIPNFLYLYGAFESSPPIIENLSKRILSWGKNEVVEDQITYNIFENYSDKETLHDSCKNDTYDTILGFFLQCLFALKAANDFCKFTHYNLHSKNVLLQKHSTTPFDIEYNYEGKKIYIKSIRGRIATIQEFSTSYIYVNVDSSPNGFGYNNYNDVPFDDRGIYNNKDFVIADAYKLMMYILATTYTENKIAFSQLKVLFSFFSSEKIEEIFEKQKENYFHLPKYEKTEEFKLTNFINFILKTFESSKVFSRSCTSAVLKTSGTCFEKDEDYIESTKKIDYTCIPCSTIQLYDYIKYYASLYSETKNKKYVEMINRIAEIFEKEFSEKINEVERNRLDSITSTLSSRFVLHELPYNVNILKKESFVELYKDFISKCVFYMNTWERMKTGIKILEFIEKGGTMYKSLFNSYNELQNKNKNFYEAVRFNLLRFYTFFSLTSYQNEIYGTILQGLTKEKHFEILKEMYNDKSFDSYFLTSYFLKSILL